MAQPDIWDETAYVTFTKLGGSNVEFCTITETVDIDIGDKNFDVINTLKGGRLVKFNPQEDTTITLEAYPVEQGTVENLDNTIGKGFMDLLHTGDVSQPISISFDRTRTKVQCVVLWTDDTSVTKATDVTTEGSSAYRIALKNGYVIGDKPAFTDGQKKHTVTVKFPAFDKSGTSNGTFESTDGSTSATLAAVASYT